MTYQNARSRGLDRGVYTFLELISGSVDIDWSYKKWIQQSQKIYHHFLEYVPWVQITMFDTIDRKNHNTGAPLCLSPNSLNVGLLFTVFN